MTKQPIRLTLLCLICLMIPAVASAQVVFIPDPSLRSIIEQKVGKAPGAAISPADMERMTELRANNENIRNLTGLEHATNLIVLWLAENNISHLVPLEGLTRLTELDLSANSISNIASLARLTNLRGLYLGENYISNLAPIARLTQLIYLNLGENRISNISYLSGLTQLRELGLWTNSITDISPLARLTNLTLLDLGVNSISDISVLAGLINLSKLWIDNNSISDLSPLVANTGLRSGDTVDVDSNPLNHASINSHIPTLRSRGVTVELEEILVQQNAVNIPDPNLRNAIEQVLGKARGAAITTDDMARLNILGATDENIRNLTGLEHATNLTELWLRDNSISDISPIAGLTRLIVLDLRDNLISNISPLARLTNLTALGLANNNIKNISSLSGLRNLIELGLGQNNVTNISPIAGLTQLDFLWLANNSISDLLPLVANSGLSRGDEVDVTGNPLSHRSLNTHIPTLQSRGVAVEFDQIVAPPQNVNIPDRNLRQAIEQALGKARAATITVPDMQRLEALHAVNKNINNLTGLEHATNLKELELQDNSISDISPLAGLTNLTLLDLRQNFISNISPLARLTNLIGIGLYDNSISNISSLARLTKLTHLNLGKNSISNISSLAGLTNLIGLRLDDNSISDISPLARLTNLTELYLQNNSISDLWPLVANTGLRNGDKLNVKGNPLTDQSIITHILTLESRGVTVEFDIVVTQVNIPDPNLRNAIERALGKARGATITADEMTRLTQLDAKNKNISNLTGLEAATNLRNLKLQENSISDISPIAGLTQMVFLYLRDNSISDISPLSRLTQLIVLQIGGNRISNISPLAGLTNLAGLGLGRNNITDISPLSRLTKLTSLGLHSNSISNISAIEKLTKLNEIFLYDNSISDLSPLVANTGLRNGDQVFVKENPLSSLSINTHIPTLQSRGVKVEFDVPLKIVNIPDPNLRNAIEKVLGKARGATITGADMERLIALHATSENITNLTGLENATNLTELRLVDNNITDISPLAGLTKLRQLWLDDNSITDISALAGLINLSELRLMNNSISDISPLVRNAGLGSADWIDLKGNFLNSAAINTHIPILESRGIVLEYDQIGVPVKIPDHNLRNAIEKVLGKASGATITTADMATLNTLHTISENIRNLTGLESATNLTELGLRNNSIANLSPLVTLTSLILLDLQDNLVSDLSPLAGLTNLTVLRLARNSITDISPLARLTKLTELNLRNNIISDISPLTRLTQLIELSLQQNIISDLSPLVANTGLGNGDRVYVRGNPLDALSLSSHIPVLQSRRVTVEFDQIVVPPQTVNIPDPNLRNAIEQVLGKARGATITVAEMETLVVLYATNKNITNLTGLEAATNLKQLRLGNNNITNISPLAGLTHLTQLWLDNNSISNISAIAGLTNLTDLTLWNNSISDLWPLVANTGLRNGDKVNVRGNPLSDISINTHIATLQSRGVTVEFDQVVVPPQTVNIPDPNLRNAIERKLGKASGAIITAAEMETLVVFYATEKNITNLTGLETATNLTNLYLTHNSISNISPLAGLTKLTVLELGNNNIRDISSLARLTNLTTLNLWKNSIADISPLATLTNLIQLTLNTNFISDISPLVGLTELKELRLHDNSISDLSPLVANTGLGNRDVVMVLRNPLSNASINNHIPTLQSRGVAVHFDPPPKNVNIPDTNLRNAIEQVLGKARGATITVPDMETLVALHATNKNITNLTGLELATNLKELRLVDNNITNVSPLAGLTKLTQLWLDENSISDISALAGLTNLKDLKLSNNSIADLWSLVANTGLGNGDKVNVKENPLSDISINTHIPTLQSRGVTVEFDQIVVPPQTVDIPDRNLRNAIEQVLGKARGATITVADMETLDVLDATNKNISNLTGLEYAIHLTELVLQNNSIADLSPLLANTGLRNGDKVNVKENPLSDLALQTIIPTLQSRGVTVEFDQTGEQPNTVNIPDRNLRSAVEQLLGKAQGATITVAEMETLDVLSAINKNITNLTGLEAATQLTILDLRDNPLSDISALAGLTNLTVLRLARNNITDISPVVRLTKLTVLNLRDNSVSDISAIAGLTNLTVLRIDINSISNISPLSRLTKLTQLYLGQNSISDLSPLVANTGLGNGDRVIVKENPLSTVSFNTHIPTLQRRGVNVEFDEIVAQPEDVNDDGVVNIFDLVSVVSEFGTQGQNLAEDVNGDGVVNIFDLVVIAAAFRDAAAAPSAQLQVGITAAEVQGWLTDAKSLDIKDPIIKRGIMVLEELLRSLAPTETQLLPNYPNPFNPETWIPYRLAEDAFVTLTIYDQAGQVVRTIDVGHQPAAVYESRSQAIYWDGRNHIGEQVASGVYFYHLAAGDYSATRKMLILK